MLSQTEIDSKEDLTRFIFNQNEFGRNATPHYVKGRAFEPRADNLETSVFRTSELDENGFWEVGARVHRDRPLNLHLYGGATVSVETIVNVGLNVKPSEPPERHALIVGWPNEKSHRISLAQQIAADANFSYAPVYLAGI